MTKFKTNLKRISLENSWRSAKEISVAEPEIDQDPLLLQSRVLLSNEQLLQIVHEASEKVDFRRLSNRQASLSHWKYKTIANNFTTFSHGDGIEAACEVLATGEMKASLNELNHILSTNTTKDHGMVMRGLYKDYIHGAVVHIIDPSQEATFVKTSEMDSRLTVKTSAFERSRMFRNHEQWCFLEHFEKGSSSDSFTVTLASVPEQYLVAGKMKADRVDDLPDLTAAYLIEKIPASNSVRVVFFAQAAFNEPNARFDQSIRNVMGGMNPTSQLHFSKKRQKRLMRLATGVSRLPDVVRRRRFGVQSLADRTSFEATNSRCTCCAKSLSFLRRKRRCHMCGYITCYQCWSLHSMESRDGRITSVRACIRCVGFVNNGDYSQVNQRKLGRVEIFSDSTFPSADPPGKALTNCLHDALQNSSGSKRKTIMAVIRHILNQEQAEASSNPTRSSLTSSIRLTDEDFDLYNDALDKGIFHVDPLPVEKCVLANVKGRNYPLKTAAEPTKMNDYPMPYDEQKRLSAIQNGGFANITDTEELDLICELLVREMNCTIGIVTLITKEEQHILASNLLPLRQLHMPREESFCQHTIMNEEPLLVPHPEADIRFQNLPALHAFNVKFYFGFPLKDNCGQVVGSVCCFDGKTHDVTASHYSSMKKLAETASKVVQIKGKQAQAI
ncbi:hypothetical protein CCR75_008804 [Bremia lactucae]|uniref:FYVE-type domain-containing protein n=1 Tax=Bremia lactucae TaxID=4779 RepID=A0A976IC48_BRELC|nr:hypothetical protein CCR75_008804 [Bremia lactucae]